MAATGAIVAGAMTQAKKTCQEETKGFADREYVQNDEQVERMFNINDDSKWEQRKEKKSAEYVVNAVLDNKPLEPRRLLFLEPRRLLFSGDLSVGKDDKHQPVGSSLLELVQRTLEMVHRTRIRTSMHRLLIRNECELESVSWHVVDGLTRVKHMREVFKVLYQNFPHHGSRYHESKWEAGLLELMGASKMTPSLMANKIGALGEKLEKTPEQWVQKWKAVMPRQAEEKILEEYRQEEVIALKWSEIKKQSPYKVGLSILEMHEQERQRRPRPEQGSIRIEQYEE